MGQGPEPSALPFLAARVWATAAECLQASGRGRRVDAVGVLEVLAVEILPAGPAGACEGKEEAGQVRSREKERTGALRPSSVRSPLRAGPSISSQ